MVTALVLAILLLAALFTLPFMGWSVLVLGVVMLGTAEWGHLSQLSRPAAVINWWLTFIAMAAILYFDGADNAQSQSSLLHLAIYGLSALLWLLLVPFWLARGWRIRQPVLMALVGWVVLIPTGLAMMDLRAASPWLLLGIMALVWMADIAAFFSGRRFGKHKLAPSISPGKTWEGVVGAALGVSCYAALAGWGSGLVHGPVNILWLVLASWLWLALSVTGDLFESAIKRQAGVKDSGTLLPGHGGLLDRIDALTSALPLAALVLALKGMA